MYSDMSKQHFELIRLMVTIGIGKKHNALFSFGPHYTFGKHKLMIHTNLRIRENDEGTRFFSKKYMYIWDIWDNT